MATPLKKKNNPVPVASAASSESASSAASSESAPAPQPVSPYAQVPQFPTQEAPEGILFDFCSGLRVKFPEGEGKYQVVFTERDTDNVVFASPAKGNDYAVSKKKYFVDYKLSLYHEGEKEPFFVHEYDAKGKTVLVQIPG